MKFYRNGNYVVCIKDDGTKIRRTDGDEFDNVICTDKAMV